MLPEDQVDRCGYGVFSLPSDHPFTPACKIHDGMYECYFLGWPIDLKASDKELLKNMLEIAGSSWKLKAEAYLFYGLATVFRKVFRSSSGSKKESSEES